MKAVGAASDGASLAVEPLGRGAAGRYGTRVFNRRRPDRQGAGGCDRQPPCSRGRVGRLDDGPSPAATVDLDARWPDLRATRVVEPAAAQAGAPLRRRLHAPRAQLCRGSDRIERSTGGGSCVADPLAPDRTQASRRRDGVWGRLPCCTGEMLDARDSRYQRSRRAGAIGRLDEVCVRIGRRVRSCIPAHAARFRRRLGFGRFVASRSPPKLARPIDFMAERAPGPPVGRTEPMNDGLARTARAAATSRSADGVRRPRRL